MTEDYAIGAIEIIDICNALERLGSKVIDRRTTPAQPQAVAHSTVPTE